MTRPLPDDDEFALKPAQATLKQMVVTMDKIIDEYTMDEDRISFTSLLIAQGLYKSRMQYWNEKYPKSVGDRYGILQDIRTSRIEDLLTKPTGHGDYKIPVANGIFYAKVCGMIEEDKARALENGNETIKLETEITIGFADEE